MSFARFALRRTAVQALRGGTIAKVLDSEMAPIDKFTVGQTVPVVMVYTDEAKAENTENGILTQDMQRLVFEVAITQKTKLPVTDPETGDVIDDQEFWQTPQTDAHMELMLDLLCRDIDLALTDPKNQWSKLFMDMAFSIKKRESVRGIAAPNEDRFAARQVVYDVMMLKEPGRGDVAPDSVWQRFITLLGDDAESAPIVGLIVKSLAHKNEQPLDIFEELRQAYGLSELDESGLLLNKVSDAVAEVE